jgi:hypothetical protein
MSETAPYTLRYLGIEPQGLDARELIHTLSAITRISIKASLSTYGSQSGASFRITEVRPGTISIQGFIELLAGAQPAFSVLPSLSLGVSDVPELIKCWFELLKFLKGEPARVVQKVEKGNAVQIENASGQTTIVNGNVYNSFIFNNVGNDASKLELPARPGAEKLEVYKGKRRIASYTRNDLATFKPIKPTDKPLESEIEAIVEVIAPVFEGDGVWKFKYGRMILTARLLDHEYRHQVLTGEESFRHGDTLRVRLKTIQERTGGKIVTKHFVTKVVGRA